MDGRATSKRPDTLQHCLFHVVFLYLCGSHLGFEGQRFNVIQNSFDIRHPTFDRFDMF